MALRRASDSPALRRRARVAAAVVLLAAAAAPAAAEARPAGRSPVVPGPLPQASSVPPAPPGLDAFVAAARRQAGDAYASGATGPDAFDCSGLVVYAAQRAHLDRELPRTSFAMYALGAHVARGEIRKGDLVFFDTAGPGASHVGIAVDAGHVVSATSSGGVMVHPLDDDYWGAHYLGARRLIGAWV
jgi:peptidoglycan DL-endopeptidase CwlO